MKVYLAGPIRGQSYKEAVEWRDKVSQRLNEYGVLGLSPMRNKEFLSRKRKIKGSYPNEVDPMSSPKGLTTRDRKDCTSSDVILVNLLHAIDEVSVGTMIEIGWADLLRIPIIVVMKGKNIHDHPMVRECAGYIVETLDEAVEIALSVLGKDITEAQSE
jgi:nucleoside 2-deoxyribosyltransferase